MTSLFDMSLKYRVLPQEEAILRLFKYADGGLTIVGARDVIMNAWKWTEFRDKIAYANGSDK